jgi:hypothetical protein
MIINIYYYLFWDEFIAYTHILSMLKLSDITSKFHIIHMFIC